MDAIDVPTGISCNLGPREVRKRLVSGVAQTIVLVVLAVGLVVADASRAWRLVLFLPASLAAVGYFQAWTRT
jgi:hypothetical protein